MMEEVVRVRVRLIWGGYWCEMAGGHGICS